MSSRGLEASPPHLVVAACPASWQRIQAHALHGSCCIHTTTKPTGPAIPNLPCLRRPYHELGTDRQEPAPDGRRPLSGSSDRVRRRDGEEGTCLLGPGGFRRRSGRRIDGHASGQRKVASHAKAAAPRTDKSSTEVVDEQEPVQAFHPVPDALDLGLRHPAPQANGGRTGSRNDARPASCSHREAGRS
jgi:hypothetical protein